MRSFHGMLIDLAALALPANCLDDQGGKGVIVMRPPKA